jgi:hypothetical protein
MTKKKKPAKKKARGASGHPVDRLLALAVSAPDANTAFTYSQAAMNAMSAISGMIYATKGK